MKCKRVCLEVNQNPSVLRTLSLLEKKPYPFAISRCSWETKKTRKLKNCKRVCLEISARLDKLVDNRTAHSYSLCLIKKRKHNITLYAMLSSVLRLKFFAIRTSQLIKIIIFYLFFTLRTKIIFTSYF